MIGLGKSEKMKSFYKYFVQLSIKMNWCQWRYFWNFVCVLLFCSICFFNFWQWCLFFFVNCVCAYMHVCVRMCMHACLLACVCVCVYLCAQHTRGGQRTNCRIQFAFPLCGFQGSNPGQQACMLRIFTCWASHGLLVFAFMFSSFTWHFILLKIKGKKYT